MKAKNQRNRNMKNQDTERRKPSFNRRICRKCRLIQTCTEQNNDDKQKMLNIQLRSSFNNIQILISN